VSSAAHIAALRSRASELREENKHLKRELRRARKTAKTYELLTAGGHTITSTLSSTKEAGATLGTASGAWNPQQQPQGAAGGAAGGAENPLQQQQQQYPGMHVQSGAQPLVGADPPAAAASYGRGGMNCGGDYGGWMQSVNVHVPGVAAAGVGTQHLGPMPGTMGYHMPLGTATAGPPTEMVSMAVHC
jgi:hypothetical protein